MDKMREEEKRSSQPHNNSAAGGRGKTEAPLGFEGMNFEQKRKPYREAVQSNRSNSNPESADESGKRGND